MPVGSDLGLNCQQRLSADDTSNRVSTEFKQKRVDEK